MALFMEQLVPSRGGQLWTTAEGDGLPLLLCNGGPGCCDYLEPVAHMLSDIAHVIRFEQSGCGRSSHTSPYDIATCLADIENVRTFYGVERWVVGGHSWGSDLALMYALRHPERVLGIICLAGGRFHNDREWHRLYDERQKAGQEPLPPFSYPPNMEVNRQGNAAWKQYIQRPTLWKELSQLDRPALFLYGADDIRPSWPIEQVAALMPKAEFHLLEGADHHLWTSQAQAMSGLLRDFVRSLTAGDTSTPAIT